VAKLNLRELRPKLRHEVARYTPPVRAAATIREVIIWRLPQQSAVRRLIGFENGATGGRVAFSFKHFNDHETFCTSAFSMSFKAPLLVVPLGGTKRSADKPNCADLSRSFAPCAPSRRERLVQIKYRYSQNDQLINGLSCHRRSQPDGIVTVTRSGIPIRATDRDSPALLVAKLLQALICNHDHSRRLARLLPGKSSATLPLRAHNQDQPYRLRCAPPSPS
jgi:hypothetical protein